MIWQIPARTKMESPKHSIFENAISPHNKIIVEEEATCIYLEEFISSEQQVSEPITEIFLEKNARLHYVKIQNENLNASHHAKIIIEQEEHSRVDFFTLSQGAKIQNDKIEVHLNAKSAECHLLGFYRLQGEAQEINHHLTIHHAAEHGESSMFYKGIIDHKSKASFTGRVIIHSNAQHIKTSQTNHNILLSKTAEAYSKPELEIYADNVKCTHGATVGELDKQALFYLLSRGIPLTTAKNILLEAFASQVFSQIKDINLRNYLLQKAGSYAEL